MTERLFVYGTLMRSSSHPFADELSRRADLEGEARYNGRLYSVSTYPGAVGSADPGEYVFGEVYLLRDPAVLRLLDNYEGCGPDAEVPAEYRRLLQTVTMDSGPQVEAWVYVYNWPVDKLQRIASGRFAEP
ncbi:MAG: gamma-glutamylcyclotransferase family protein [Pseudomonadota bacterium]